MFTFRAHLRDDEELGRHVFEASHYKAIRGRGARATLLGLYDSVDPEVPASRILEVGNESSYSVVYVMNASGKTVDTIR